MEPYQRASAEIQRQGEIPLKLAKDAAGIAATGAGAYYSGGLINRVLPFLSNFIPEDLAIKGLNKIDPRFGNFINKAKEGGQSFEQIKDFIFGKAEEGTPPQSRSNERSNPIKQHSPELAQFIEGEIQQGRSPLEAAALAELPAKGRDFKSIIKKIAKEHKTPWGALVEAIYGTQIDQNKNIQSNSQQLPQIQQGQQANRGWAAIDSLSDDIRRGLNL